MSGKTPAVPPGGAARRRSALFLVRFLLLLGVFAFLVAWTPVNDSVIVPFTAGVARVSGAILTTFSEPVTVAGTELRSPGFSVDIENGCNGIETALLFCSAVLAFPASWKARVAGLFLGFFAIQLLNLVRVVSLFWIGRHRPSLFSAAHTVLWQSAVVIAGVLLFLLWASRQRSSAAPAEP